MVLGFMNQLAPTFLQVGGEGENAKVTLADFKVGGYADPYVLEGLKISIINGNGITETDEASGLFLNYTWQDFPEAGVPAGWYDDESGILVSAERLAQLKAEGYEDLVQSVFGDAAGVEFNFGTGFRVTPSSDYEDYNFSLTFSGEVRQGQSVFDKMNLGFFNLMGNCSPVEVTLAQLIVGGYEDPYVLEGLKISEINGNGITDTDEKTGLLKNYTWQDFPEAGVPAGWYDDESGILVSAERLAQLKAEGYEDLVQSAFGDAAGIKFPAGYGFRVTPSSDYEDYNFTLTIPSPMGK